MLGPQRILAPLRSPGYLMYFPGPDAALLRFIILANPRVAMTHPCCLLLAATAAAAAAAGRHPPMADVGVVPALQRGHHARARADGGNDFDIICCSVTRRALPPTLSPAAPSGCSILSRSKARADWCASAALSNFGLF